MKTFNLIFNEFPLNIEKTFEDYEINNYDDIFIEVFLDIKINFYKKNTLIKNFNFNDDIIEIKKIMIKRFQIDINKQKLYINNKELKNNELSKNLKVN